MTIPLERTAPIARLDPSLPPPGSAIAICEQWPGSNGYAGTKALRRAGWSVQLLPEREFVPLRWRSGPMRLAGRALRRGAVRELNRAILRQADRSCPELVVVWKGAFVMADTLRALRARGVRTYCFYPDVSFRAHGPYIPAALPEYDWVFTTKSFGVRDMREQLGVARASLVQHAFDPDVHRPVALTSDDRQRYGADVSFIGTWSPKKENLLRCLVEQRPDLRLRVWGEQWHAAKERGGLRLAVEGHEITGEEYARAICASAINLSILSERRAGASAGDQITSRTFHIPACGGFMLHERTDELLSLFEEDVDVACFSDADELSRQIDTYLGHPERREALARAAHARVVTRDSWDTRIRQILARHVATRRV